MWLHRLALAAPAAVAALLAQGIATRNVKPAPRPPFSGKPWRATFIDVSRPAGFTSALIYGGTDRTRYLVETSSGGVALIDFDGDGWLDVFFTGGTRFGAQPPSGAGHRLYRNQRDGTFADVTARAGLQSAGWYSGVAVGDFDGDGHDDLFVTAWGPNALYRNRGDGTFEDVTARVGLADTENRWSSGATFVDYDRDGDLDLFVASYVAFDIRRVPEPGANPNCSWKGVAVACGPRGLPPPPRHHLYRNEKGRFVEVGEAAGISVARGSYAMTAVAADFDDDGWPDIYVACDSTPSFFFHNQRNGTFREEGIERGVALNEDGREQAGMGVALGDYNLDGRLDLFKTHFSDDNHILYRNEGRGQFVEVTQAAGLAVETRYVGWGTVFADFDHDGWPDLLYVTGNVYPETERELPAYPYRSPRRLFRNLGNGRFEQIEGMPALDAAWSSRGMVSGDLDNDGDLDVVIWNRNDPPTVLRNDLGAPSRWLQLTAPIGTRVTATYDGKRQVQEVVSQASFYSAPGRRLHFGLGAAAAADLEIRWPDGRSERRRAVNANQIVNLTPGVTPPSAVPRARTWPSPAP